MKDIVGILLFVVALAFLTFLAGAAVMNWQVFPSEQLKGAFQAATDVATSDTDKSGITGTHFLYPARYDESGVTVYDEEKAQPGVTLVTGYWWQEEADRWQPAVRLIDMTGEVLHEWPVKPEEIWPETPFSDHMGGQMSNPSNYVHGSWLLPGGDLVFNVEYAGLVRMNACGEVQWTLPYRTHHSVFRDDTGNFWVAGLTWRYEKNPDYVHMKAIFADEAMLQVSPDGTVLQEIFVLNSFYKSGYGGLFADMKKNWDLTHMNDVETLGEELADDFPMFSAGDIMVSLRNIGTVAIIDGNTHDVKWHFRHPLVRQHDPDFEAGGNIVIFDNRDDMTQEGQRLGPTRLISVNPATKEWTTIYPLSDEQAFYTQTGGKHQLLDNGNRLITEVHGGRVMEVDKNGDVVWNWIIDTLGDGQVPEVTEGTRYPAKLAEFSTAACGT